MGGCAEPGLAGAAPADGPSRDRRRVEAVDVGPVGWLVLVSPRAGRGGASRRSCGLVSPQPLNVGQHERPTLAGRLDGALEARLTSMTSTTTSHNAPGDRFKRRWLTSLTHQRRPHIRRQRHRPVGRLHTPGWRAACLGAPAQARATSRRARTRLSATPTRSPRSSAPSGSSGPTSRACRSAPPWACTSPPGIRAACARSRCTAPGTPATLPEDRRRAVAHARVALPTVADVVIQGIFPLAFTPEMYVTGRSSWTR